MLLIIYSRPKITFLFGLKMEKWKPDCKWELCKDYIGHVGDIQIAE